MNALLWLPRLLYKLYFFLVFVTSLILLYPLFYWSTTHESKFARAFRQMKNWALFLQLANGIWIKKYGKENIPTDGPFIVCANHASYLDIILMYRVLPHYFVMMGKGEIRGWPLFRRFFLSGMNILVDRDSRIAAHNSLEQAKTELDKERNIVIFPEGGIPHNTAPKMRGFKNGAFKMAIEKQVPILPVTYQTNWKLLDGTRTLHGSARPGISKIFIHKPIYTNGLAPNDASTLRKQTYEAINAPLISLIKN